MNPLVKKEIRLLLPGWAASMLLALGTWLIPQDLESAAAVFLGLLFPATLALTALGSFGGEVSAGTFSSLLAQPMARARIWRTKTLLLAVAVASVWVVGCVSLSLHFPMKYLGPGNARDLWLFTGLYAVATYSSGLWTVLLLRQVTAAFWFALLIPLALVVTTLISLPPGVSDQTSAHVLTFVFLVYGVAGYGWARWLFLRAQDAQWTGGPITLPAVRGPKWLGGWRATDAGLSVASLHRNWRPRTALLIKELQLHQSEFVIAGVMALLHLAAVVARHVGHFNPNSGLGVALDCYWWLWLMMPFLIGCAAVAEERKLGTLEGQLCLPVKRRTQFAVKVFVVVALSILASSAKSVGKFLRLGEPS